MTTSTALPPLTAFKEALLPGARLTVRFEDVTIHGNLIKQTLPGGSGTREVLSRSDRRVVFRTERGGETVFNFPPSAEIASPEPGVFTWSPNGKLCLTYCLVP